MANSLNKYFPFSFPLTPAFIYTAAGHYYMDMGMKVQFPGMGM